MSGGNNTQNGNGTSSSQSKIIVVTGATATGKTALGIEIARRFGGEVVNADSRYLYAGFDIGVAKPTIEERRGIPHHLIDILPPDGTMSLARFQDLATAAIWEVLDRGALPILVGGTPLYINAVVEGWRIPRVEPDPVFRQVLEEEADRNGLASLEARLAAIDPVAASRSHGNLRRVIRAIEVYDATGIPMSEQEGKGPHPWDTLELGLFRDRTTLHGAIDERVHALIEAGLVDEVRALLDAGVPEDAPAMTSIGYRQLLPHLQGRETLQEAMNAIISDTKRYVRHQETWLRRNERLIRVCPDDPGWRTRVFALIDGFLGQA